MAQELKQVIAYEVYAIYAHYDAYVPTTEDLLLVGTEDLARQVAACLNKDRIYN